MAALAGEEIIVQKLFSTRPYQHVPESAADYLMIAARQYEDRSLKENYNIGPEESDCRTTGDLADMFCREWRRQAGKDIHWINRYGGGPHEANFLKPDCLKSKIMSGWKLVWNVEKVMEKIAEWTLALGRMGMLVRQSSAWDFRSESLYQWLKHPW